MPLIRLFLLYPLLAILAVLVAILPTAAHERAAETAPDSDDSWVTAAIHAPQVQYRTFDSAIAQARVSYHVYTPAQYAREPQRHFPVLYWLHGHGGGLIGIPRLVRRFDTAIRAGLIPPMLVVFPNGMAESMWCDARDGSVPMESMVMKELVPQIDASFRTIVRREGRMVEGFSMGGYGAARLGLKYDEVFAAVSLIGAGPLQQTFDANIGPARNAHARSSALHRVYGDDQAYFAAQSPWVLAEQYAIRPHMAMTIRQLVGQRDELTVDFNRDFHEHLLALGIAHSYVEVPGIGHNVDTLFDALGGHAWDFYRRAFGQTRAREEE